VPYPRSDVVIAEVYKAMYDPAAQSDPGTLTAVIKVNNQVVKEGRAKDEGGYVALKWKPPAK
jgi:hypothetical protein